MSKYLYNKTLNKYSKLILNANIYDVVKKTPLHKASHLSALTNNNILFKREDLQDIHSFKIRGAYNKILQLSEQEKKQGVVACSAGNHAQGVAYLSNKLKINSTIVMPLTAPQIKIDSVKQLGQEYTNVLLYGNTFDDSSKKAKEIEKKQNTILIKPFDDEYVISGAGTIGQEILQQYNNIDKIFIPCGGGGILSGVAAWVKFLKPEIKIIGVESEDAAGMTLSIKNNKLTELDTVGFFTDGTAVKKIGKETFKLCNMFVDEMITVSTDEICSAIKIGFNDTRVILEPSGALSIAGMYKYINKNKTQDKTLVAITSGSNIDFTRMRFISERTDINEKLINVTIPEQKGSFHKLYSDIDNLHGVITEFNYRYSDKNNASIYMSFKSKCNNIINNLTNIGYDINDLSNNELAKSHTRYLSKNTILEINNELIIRFEFPNNNNNLKDFLNKLNMPWNISLFHYRNHGSDIARILIGFQVENKDNDNFFKFLDNLSYVYYNETDNYNNIL
jgi:threonine dehydratase